jgi:hypothetical protein
MTAPNPAGQDGIFIGYRSDGSFAADWLDGRLAHQLGSKRIFYAPARRHAVGRPAPAGGK